MPYKYTIESVVLRKEDNVDTAVVIDIKCENTITGSATSAMPEIKKAQFAKWPPSQAGVEAKAWAYLKSMNGATSISKELEAKVKNFSDSPLAISKVELNLEAVAK